MEDDEKEESLVAMFSCVCLFHSPSNICRVVGGLMVLPIGHREGSRLQTSFRLSPHDHPPLPYSTPGVPLLSAHLSFSLSLSLSPSVSLSRAHKGRSFTSDFTRVEPSCWSEAELCDGEAGQ